jgi:predicted transcriptional regulator
LKERGNILLFIYLIIAKETNTEAHMPKVTVKLSDELYRALKETAARRDVSMREIIEESLEFAGLKTTEDARELVSKARRRAALNEEDVLDMAVSEIRKERS